MEFDPETLPIVIGRSAKASLANAYDLLCLLYPEQNPKLKSALDHINAAALDLDRIGIEDR